jgi:hypothetical protein
MALKTPNAFDLGAPALWGKTNERVKNETFYRHALSGDFSKLE